MRYEVLMAKLFLVLWVVTPCGLVGRYQHSEEHTVSIFRAEDRSIKFLQNIGIYLKVHMELQPRRPTLTWPVMSFDRKYTFL
jgi:hypothetical protein